jgi:hypothetical protein
VEQLAGFSRCITSRSLEVRPKTRKYCGLLTHDFRRGAARNLIKAGVSPHVAKKITGHKTGHIFDRYTIQNTADVREALIKVGRAGAVAEMSPSR